MEGEKNESDMFSDTFLHTHHQGTMLLPSRKSRKSIWRHDEIVNEAAWASVVVPLRQPYFFFLLVFQKSTTKKEEVMTLHEISFAQDCEEVPQSFCRMQRFRTYCSREAAEWKHNMGEHSGLQTGWHKNAQILFMAKHTAYGQMFMRPVDS